MRELLRAQALVLCGCLGGLAGAALSAATLGRWALERFRAEHPGEYACGMFALPYLSLGLLLGAAVGVAAGWRAQRWLAGTTAQAPPPGAATDGGHGGGP